MKTGANKTKTPWWRVTVLPLHFSPVNSTAAGGQQLLFFKRFNSCLSCTWEVPGHVMILMAE